MYVFLFIFFVKFYSEYACIHEKNFCIKVDHSTFGGYMNNPKSIFFSSNTRVV